MEKGNSKDDVVKVTYVQRLDLKYLEVDVQQLIKEGWELYGPISVNPNSDRPYVQQMVKYPLESTQRGRHAYEPIN